MGLGLWDYVVCFTTWISLGFLVSEDYTNDEWEGVRSVRQHYAIRRGDVVMSL